MTGKRKEQRGPDAAEREQRANLFALCRAARRKHHPCGGVKMKERGESKEQREKTSFRVNVGERGNL